MNITDLLQLSVEHNASDLHLSAGIPPLMRIDGDLQRMHVPELSQQEVQSLLYDIMNDKQRKIFAKCYEVDFSFTMPELGRFRVNVFQQNRGISGVLRVIPATVLTLKQLQLPAIFKTLAATPRGLILVTGATGSGKSTTLAAMLDYINHHFYKHVLSIEDPIEFIHVSHKCLFNQREIHRDTLGFNQALRSALRADPDIMLVGEMRDLETIRLALTAAETGHLVFATLHTLSAAKTINRIIDVFPTAEKQMVRTLLSESLVAVISQVLLKRIAGGRIAANEIMICTPAIRNLIREDKIAQIYSAIQTGQALGMRTLEQHLKSLIQEHEINPDQAERITNNKTFLQN
jgi:twitching motility protein PilT